MILSDSEIKNHIKQWKILFEWKKWYDIYDQVWPASLDFRLGNEFKFYDQYLTNIIDPKNMDSLKDSVRHICIKDWDFFVLHPNQYVLWVTAETIWVPDNLVARCEWRSSLWRLGLIIHSTAWFIDPWFQWTITLEITNINQVPIKLYPWMRIWQFTFETILWNVDIPYNSRIGSKYMHQKSPQESRIWKDCDY